jgi:putative transposase
MDRLVCLGLLRDQARLTDLPVLAYCLMSNHIHPIAVPLEGAQLAEVMQRVHGRYAQFFNARRTRCGNFGKTVSVRARWDRHTFGRRCVTRN